MAQKSYTVMQPQVTTRMVPMPVSGTTTMTVPTVTQAEQEVGFVSESEAIANRLMRKVNLHETKSSIPEIKKTATVADPDTETELGAAANEAKMNMQKAQAEVDAAEAKLADFQKELDAATKDALAAERTLERALDNRKEMEEAVAAASNILVNAPSSEKDRIDQKMRQAEMDVEQARGKAEASATTVLSKTKSGEIFKFNVDQAREVLANRNAEFTLAACRAALSGKTEWMDVLSGHYKEKFAYKCKYTGFEGDFFDVDKSERTARGEYTGLSFQGTSQAPVLMASALPAAQQRLYVSQPNIVSTGQPSIMTSQPNIMTSQPSIMSQPNIMSQPRMSFPSQTVTSNPHMVVS